MDGMVQESSQSLLQKALPVVVSGHRASGGALVGLLPPFQRANNAAGDCACKFAYREAPIALRGCFIRRFCGTLPELQRASIIVSNGNILVKAAATKA